MQGKLIAPLMYEYVIISLLPYNYKYVTIIWLWLVIKYNNWNSNNVGQCKMIQMLWAEEIGPKPVCLMWLSVKDTAVKDWFPLTSVKKRFHLFPASVRTVLTSLRLLSGVTHSTYTMWNCKARRSFRDLFNSCTYSTGYLITDINWKERGFHKYSQILICCYHDKQTFSGVRLGSNMRRVGYCDPSSSTPITVQLCPEGKRSALHNNNTSIHASRGLGQAGYVSKPKVSC